jgi:hypothetical protein
VVKVPHRTNQGRECKTARLFLCQLACVLRTVISVVMPFRVKLSDEIYDHFILCFVVFSCSSVNNQRTENALPAMASTIEPQKTVPTNLECQNVTNFLVSQTLVLKHQQ